MASIALAFLVPAVFAAVRQRPGAVPWEPVLPHLPALQLSVPIFTVQYATIALVAVRLVRRPGLLPRAVHAVALLVTLRMVTIGMVALDPPPDLVTLQDPINQLLYGGIEPLTRDLFFSGHTALMVLLVFLAGPGAARRLAAAAAVAVAVMLVLQHVHWTIDVLAAPAFAALAWWVSGRTAPAVSGVGPASPGR
ncbi:hypothetical protein FDO65_01155 [Nakamurella flava]|uniref:Sphingomyelin synthase-like domain-containing protein n=1 Tax=Nakamurella flava TaxID=2576308 RepID=A0A4U6QIU8_9ACTN|nr:phosphatase PAP2-related protein [Nakamurella flava]TKV60354.1 hypothetical protein FDO65_01155 [Nakamurella flava]